MLDSRIIFSDVINKLTSVLEETGLYVANCHMEIESNKRYSDLETLRKDVINNQAGITLDVDCFIGNALWRVTEDYTNPAKFISFDFSDIEQYFKETGGQGEEEEF